MIIQDEDRRRRVLAPVLIELRLLPCIAPANA